MLSKLAEFEIIEKDEIFSAYNLRHTYITDLMKRGFTSSQVALLVGNSAEITDRTYNHSTSRDVMELLKNTQKQGQRTNGSEKTCRQRTKKGVDNSP
jgi:integrase